MNQNEAELRLTKLGFHYDTKHNFWVMPKWAEKLPTPINLLPFANRFFCSYDEQTQCYRFGLHRFAEAWQVEPVITWMEGQKQ